MVPTKDFEHLFEPGQIGSLKLKNRIIMAPMGSRLCGLWGEVSDDLIEWYETRARGGASLIICECTHTATAFDPVTMTTRQLRADDFSFIPGLCEEGQIDLNTASKTELEELPLVGPVKAQAIIDSRPLNSIEAMLDIYGIGEKTLEGIKQQGLACVDVEVEEIEEKEELEEVVEEIIQEESIDEEGDEEKGKEIITLTAKTIKTQDNNEDKSNYAIYGFVGFCILLGILFIIKKKKYKNEFR